MRTVLIENSDRILDSQCVIELRNDDTLLVPFNSMRVSIPGISIISTDTVELFLFVPKEGEISREMRIFLQQSNAIDLGVTWAIRAKSTEFPPVENFRIITGIPSAVLDGVILSGGSMKIYIRFNHERTEEVSGAIAKASSLVKGLVPIYLGRSKGILKFLREISSLMPLDYISLSSYPPDSEKTPENNPVPTPWVREVKYMSNSGIDAVYLSSAGSAANASITDYSGTGHSTYEARTSNDVLQAISEEAASDPIPTFSRFQSFDGSLFQMDFVVPRNYSNKFIKIVAWVSQNFPDWKISISQILSIENLF